MITSFFKHILSPMYFMLYIVFSEVKMKRKKKRKIKIKNVLILVGVIVLIVIIFKKSPEKEIITADIIDTYVGKSIGELEQIASENELIIDKEYEYSKTMEKDLIISTEFSDNKINVTGSAEIKLNISPLSILIATAPSTTGADK